MKAGRGSPTCHASHVADGNRYVAAANEREWQVLNAT